MNEHFKINSQIVELIQNLREYLNLNQCKKRVDRSAVQQVYMIKSMIHDCSLKDGKSCINSNYISASVNDRVSGCL